MTSQLYLDTLIYLFWPTFYAGLVYEFSLLVYEFSLLVDDFSLLVDEFSLLVDEFSLLVYEFSSFGRVNYSWVQRCE